MPVKNGVDASREITDALPETKVLILTASTQNDAVVEALAAGATGYLQKHSGKETLLRAIRDVADGEYRIPSDLMRRVFVGTRTSARPGEASGLRNLTSREQEILRSFSLGMSYRRHLWHPGQAGDHDETGTGGLGCAERLAGGRSQEKRIASEPPTARQRPRTTPMCSSTESLQDFDQTPPRAYRSG